MPKIKSFKPVDAKSHTPPYKIHRYFARRPWNLFDALVQHYADSDQIILDPFAGGGVTPYESVKNSVKVIACDLNPLSNYIIRNMFHSAKIDELDVAFKEVVEYAEGLNQESFHADCSECKTENTADWFELAHTVECDLCESRITLVEQNKIRNGIYRCPNKKCWNSKTGLKVARIKRKEPVYLFLRGKCRNCNTSYSVEVDSDRLNTIRIEIATLKKLVKAQGAGLPDEMIPLDWDRQKEDLLYEKGFERFQDLFTKESAH